MGAIAAPQSGWPNCMPTSPSLVRSSSPSRFENDQAHSPSWRSIDAVQVARINPVAECAEVPDSRCPTSWAMARPLLLPLAEQNVPGCQNGG